MNPSTPGDPPMKNDGDASSHAVLRIWIAVAIFGVTFFAITGTAGLYCCFAPRVYFSKVELKRADIRIIVVEDGMTPLPQPWTIPSKQVLFPVIENLKLVEIWSKREGKSLSKEEVFNRLLQCIDLTGICADQIGVYSPDRQEAANIANMIVAVYRDMRRNPVHVLSQLRDEIGAQKKRMEALQIKLKELRERDGISDPDAEKNTREVTSSDPKQQQEYIDTKNQYSNAQRFIEQLEQDCSTQNIQLMAYRRDCEREKAEPAMHPAKPKIPLIMTVASVSGGLLGLLASGFFLLWGCRSRKANDNP